jgi:hypothetical protein
VAVGILHVVIDFCDQFLHAAKGSPAKSLLGNAVEPDFHLIEPGGIGRSEVCVESWSCGEPASNSQMFHSNTNASYLWDSTLVCGPGVADRIEGVALRIADQGDDACNVL